MKRLLLITIFGMLAINLTAKVTLPSILGDNMVLQRNTTVKLWGTATAGKQISVITSWNGKTTRTTVDTQGGWLVEVTTPEAGGPYAITFSDGEKLVLNNVMSGEVWLCSGQSNMEMPLRGFPSQPTKDALPAIMTADKHPQIRLFSVGRTTTQIPQDNCKGEWVQSSMASAADFSAVGYFFALSLYENLGIPVGMIQSSWGGTRIEAWMSPDAAKKVDAEVMKTDASNNEPNQVAALYNAMIYPLTNFAIKGFIWYQGESNKGGHKTYDKNMAEMVALWRDKWGNANMPFYFTEIAPFDYDIPMHRFNGETNDIIRPLIVEAQVRALGLIPNSGIAATGDIGDAVDIHPAPKAPIAQRLALMALCRDYGRKFDDYASPVMESVRYENGKAYVTFKTASTLHPVNGTPVKEFYIAGEDRVFYPANAVVEGEKHVFNRTVIVSSDKVSNPVAVRYAFRNVVQPNLTNTISLPALPFRTDNWDDVK